MKYNELAFDTFIDSLEVPAGKKEAIKVLYLNQLEHLVNEDVKASTIKEVSGLNIPMIKGFNFLKNVGEDFKKNVAEFFEDDKKEE